MEFYYQHNINNDIVVKTDKILTEDDSPFDGERYKTKIWSYCNPEDDKSEIVVRIG